MNTGIITELDGYLQQAKQAKTHVLPWFSDQVIAKLAKDGKDHLGRDLDVHADVEAHVQRTFKRLRLKDDGSLRSAIVAEAAMDSYGFYKECEARGINLKRDSGEKFFNVTANTPLFPAFIATSYIEGRVSAGLADLLVYADVQIDRLTYDKVRLNEVEGKRQLRRSEIGADLPLTELSQLGTNIRLNKYGRFFRYVREVVELSPLDIIAGFLRKLGRQVALDETDEVIEILHAGDGETGSAVTDTTPATDGTITYADLIKLELAFGNGYMGNIGVVTATAFQTILGMAEYKDPLASRGVVRDRRIPRIPTPSGAGDLYRWGSTNSTYMAESGGRVLLVDNTEAAYIIRNGDVMEEMDTNIRNGTNEVAISQKMAVVKGDPENTKSLDITA